MNDFKDETYTPNNIPDDALVFTNKNKEFDPLEEGQYQVEISDVILRKNSFWKEVDKDGKPASQANRYLFSFTLIILSSGEFRGRRLWVNTSLSFKPNSQKGPTILYKIVNKALKTIPEMDWDGCAAFAPDTKTLYNNLLTQVKEKQINIMVENISKDDGTIKSKPVMFFVAKEYLPSYKQGEEEKEYPVAVVSEDIAVDDHLAEPTDEDLKNSHKDDIADDIPF